MRSAAKPVGLFCSVVALAAGAELFCADNATAPSNQPPTGMAWIPPGEFTMGTDDTNSLGNERPAHRVLPDGFWMDPHAVTNTEFTRFIEETAYITTAERRPEWEELRKQLAAGTPRPSDDLLVAGSLVLAPASRPVPLNDMRGWWRWIRASWKTPEGVRDSETSTRTTSKCTAIKSRAAGHAITT